MIYAEAQTLLTDWQNLESFFKLRSMLLSDFACCSVTFSELMHWCNSMEWIDASMWQHEWLDIRANHILSRPCWEIASERLSQCHLLLRTLDEKSKGIFMLILWAFYGLSVPAVTRSCCQAFVESRPKWFFIRDWQSPSSFMSAHLKNVFIAARTEASELFKVLFPILRCCRCRWDYVVLL